MSGFPKIQRAIPQRRYQYGEYAVTVLGDIESGDGRDYRFIAAFVREGESQPRLFVASERLPPGRRGDGSHALRLINSAMDEVLDVGDQWAVLDAFVDQALQLGAQTLGLDQEVPYQLM
ncbi:MAG: hypothetical protein H6953_15590 [Chromatiaceae bacterium]|nr:hypothetical protein [Gammaproteobacteria bacterium]MCP5306867.1 hypothetical protein [Chromatiaceae bacterium]MCP5316170.1 hypothetical protein [Chromatiaceae bacterium]